MDRPPRFPVIIGPTAAGKSSLAVDVAQAFQRESLAAGEIISADAYQVYRRMDLGTAKPTPDERRGVPHHLIDILEPNDPEPFSVHRWLQLAEGLIAEMGWADSADETRDRLEAGSTEGDRLEAGPTERRIPIVVGGTHLYIKALLDGVFDGPGADEQIRSELESWDPAKRRAELERIDPAAAARIHPNDARRTIRALEVFRLTGKPISAWQGQWDRGSRANCLLVILGWDAEAINRRINARVRDMIEQGLVEEVRALADAGQIGPQATQALGYKQILRHLAGECSLAEAVERIKIETRRFAKNQRTWIRRLQTTPGAIRMPGEKYQDERIAQTIVNACFTQSK